MAFWMEYPLGETRVPIELVIGDPLTVTSEVASFKLRRVSDNAYLDFADSKFKTSGWVQQSQPLSQSTPGRYHYVWNSSAAVLTPTTLVIEYDSNGPDVFGSDNDVIAFSNSAAILDKLSKSPSASVGDGPGSCKFTYTVTQATTSIVLEGVNVYVTTDVAGYNIIAGPKLTDVNGKVIFYLNNKTVYYFWRTKGGYEFSNPQAIQFN